MNIKTLMQGPPGSTTSVAEDVDAFSGQMCCGTFTPVNSTLYQQGVDLMPLLQPQKPWEPCVFCGKVPKADETYNSYDFALCRTIGCPFNFSTIPGSAWNELNHAIAEWNKAQAALLNLPAVELPTVEAPPAESSNEGKFKTWV